MLTRKVKKMKCICLVLINVKMAVSYLWIPFSMSALTMSWDDFPPDDHTMNQMNKVPDNRACWNRALSFMRFQTIYTASMAGKNRTI